MVAPVVAAVPSWPPVPGEVPSVGLTSVLPVDGRLDVDEGAVAVAVLLADADADELALGFFDGLELAVEVAQGEPVAAAAAFLLPVALVFAVAEAVVVAVLAALPLAVAVALLVAVAVLVAEALPLPEGLPLVLPLAGLLLVLPLEPLLTGDVCEPPGVTLGVRDLAGLATAAEDDDGHAVGDALRALDDEPAGPAPPAAELAALPEPSRLGAFPLGLEDDEIPTAEPSWTKASRSGGRESTTPMANTAQAAARSGLSSPSRQSRGRCRTRLVARAGPDLTRARIRSSPSGRGSTWSAAACSARRRYSPKSMGSGPCGGGPSNPDLVITLAPGQRAGRSCRGRCGS